jgi:glutamyl-tRNA synthetase
VNKIRTRFAPSPTGYIHVGGIRTALFAWLIAQKDKGDFILRLEDTDKNREVEGSGTHIIESLKWLGLNYNEGPDIGGKFAPYRQSERLPTYQEWAQKLIQTGRAYADPFTPAEVQSFREEAIKNKKPFLYRNHRPNNPSVWDGKTPLRFKSDPKNYTYQDAVMGKINTKPESIDDFILIKSDGFPTYNFAHIVDDAEMQITHIIRGQEFLASVPNYLNLYEALNIKPPIIATVPHVLGKEGNKKLSKRDGAKDILDYQKEGYLPQAMINFLATLGWNDGTTQEVYTPDELISKFDLSRVQKGGAHFDEQRLIWLNGAHIRNLSLDELFAKVEGYWPKEADDYDENYKKQVLALTQERLKTLNELAGLTRFFFVDLPIDPGLISNHKQLKKLAPNQLKDLLNISYKSLQQSDFTVQDLTDRLNSLLKTTEQKPAVLFSLIRIATTQAPASPTLAESMAVIGKEKSLNRILKQIENL